MTVPVPAPTDIQRCLSLVRSWALGSLGRLSLDLAAMVLSTVDRKECRRRERDKIDHVENNPMPPLGNIIGLSSATREACS